MTFEEESKRQADLALWINEHHAHPFQGDARQQLAFAAFDLALEHHAAICSLGVGGLFGSLFALLRILFEAYGRGLWLRHVASDADVQHFFSEDEPPLKFGQLLASVEKQLGIQVGPLTTLKSNHWQMFCSFAHTGYQALYRRMSATHTGPVNYTDEELVAALQAAGAFAILAAVELASMYGDAALVKATQEKAREYAVQ
ncbi:MAG: hypothetical protein JWR16_1575 [Nevskia sp.]|nr:hypothetical protein [Nevskia sp.]